MIIINIKNTISLKYSKKINLVTLTTQILGCMLLHLSASGGMINDIVVNYRFETLGVLIQGFIEGSADKIFESTND